jgi:hypothetical protein
MNENIDFVLHAVAGAVALLFVFESTRRICAYGVHRGAVLMFVLSSAACAFAGGFAYQKYTTLNAVVAGSQRQPPPAKPIAANFNKPVSPEKRELFAQAAAKQTFKEFGALGSYVDRNGETRPFVPAADDIKARERVVAYYSQTDFAARNSLAEVLLWVTGFGVAVLLGLIMSFAKPPAPKAPGEDAPATS